MATRLAHLDPTDGYLPIYGDILDCAYQWGRHCGGLDAALGGTLRAQMEAARQAWRRPDNGIWELRSPGRIFTYSAALCQVALDLYDRLCTLVNPVGLLPKQIDPRTGAFIGNFSQTFSHIGLISSGVNLARSLRGGAR